MSALSIKWNGKINFDIIMVALNRSAVARAPPFCPSLSLLSYDLADVFGMILIVDCPSNSSTAISYLQNAMTARRTAFDINVLEYLLCARVCVLPCYAVSINDTRAMSCVYPVLNHGRNKRE